MWVVGRVFDAFVVINLIFIDDVICYVKLVVIVFKVLNSLFGVLNFGGLNCLDL